VRRHVVMDRFQSKPLEVTIIRNGIPRVYTGKQAKKWAKFFGLHKRQRFIVYPNV